MKRNLLLLGLLLFSSSVLAQSDSLRSKTTVSDTVVNVDDSSSYVTDSTGIDEKASKPDTIRITIGAIGDIMAHQTQLKSQLQSNGQYDFRNNFEFVKPLFESTDLMIGNLETTLAGERKGFSAYPRFNTPDAMAEAMKWAGINLVATANNHCYDTETKGLRRTIDVLEQLEMPYVGTRKSADEKNYRIIDFDDSLKVGVTAFTFESGRINSLKTINGIKVEQRDTELINSFNPYDENKEIEMLEKCIAKMKVNGANFIVVVMHWGTEYQTEANKDQRELAQRLNRLGVDIIFGSHPHVVQPVDFIKNDSSNQLTYVAYSLGNFISNQRYETLEDYNTEDGLFSQLVIEKIDGQRPIIKSVKHHSLWVRRKRSGYKYVYHVIPTEAAMADLKAYGFENQEDLGRLHRSYNRTEERIYQLRNSRNQNHFKKLAK